MSQDDAVQPVASLPTCLRLALEKKQLPALDGLRAVAVFLVVFYHCGTPMIPGGLGVLAFFVLSGFLITWLMLEEQDRYGAVSLRLFYVRRTLRIFPAFYAYWLLIVVRTAFTHKVVWAQAVASFFYVNNYYQAIHGDPNTGLSHTWSLGVEEQFYLLWPVAFLFLQRFPRIKAARIIGSAIMLFWCYRWGLMLAGVHQGYLYEAFDARADHLLSGCFLAFGLRSGLLALLWRILCSHVVYSLCLVGVLVCSTVLENRYGSGYRDAVGFVVSPVVIALLIPAAMSFRSSLAWGWLNCSVTRYLGRISYSLYLYQQITPNLVEKLLPHATAAAMMTANAGLVIVAATASYYLIERPFLKLKDRFARVHHNPV